MPQIILLSPPTTVINGGIRHIFRMAEVLRALGHDAVVFEQNQHRPTWFPSTVPIVGQSIFQPGADQILVLPEDQPHILESFKTFPQRKIIYSQNHFYGALGIGDANSYADYGVTHILCSSRTIYNHARLRHPKLKAYIIPCVVNADTFKSAATKTNSILFMPRKRAIEATYIRDMFRFTYPHYRDWQWTECSGKSEAEVAHLMSTAKIFLSLSRLEGFGITPLEAMASGCIIAGFTGIGGQEYANDQNGFWCAEDDFPTCVQQLGKAAALTDTTAYKAATQKTLSAYTPETFKQATQSAWAEILA